MFSNGYQNFILKGLWKLHYVKLWVGTDSTKETSIYINSSIPKHQYSAGYIICWTETKWKWGVPFSLEVPRVPAQHLSTRVDPILPTSRLFLGWRAAAIAGQGQGCNRPITFPRKGARWARSTHCELSELQACVPFFFYQTSLIKTQLQRQNY